MCIPAQVDMGIAMFLDEIGEMPIKLQTKLLQVFQDGEFERLGSSRTIQVNVRGIAGTNRDLEEEVRKGRELENVIERTVISSSGPKLRLVDELKPPQKDLPTPLKTMEAVEYDHIVRVLERTDWKVSGKDGAAEILGLKRGTLRARMQKLGIRKP